MNHDGRGGQSPSGMPYPNQPGQPGFGRSYPSQQFPPSKKNTGLIVGIVVGLVVLIGLGVGAIFLFQDNDEATAPPPSATASPEQPPPAQADPGQLAAACPLLDPAAVSAALGVPNPQPIEVPRGADGLTDFKLGCIYGQPGKEPFAELYVKVYESGTCQPDICIGMFNEPDQHAVVGAGEAGVYFIKDGRATMVAMETIGGRPVQVMLKAPGPDLPDATLMPQVKAVLDKVKQG